jgi:hypothetical protein
MAKTYATMLVLFLLTQLVCDARLGAQNPAIVQRLAIEDAWYLAQPGDNNTLRLTANECFFDGSGLTAIGDVVQDQPGNGLNGRKFFTAMQGLTQNNRVSWYLHFKRGGQVQIRSTGTANSALAYELADQQGTVPANGDPSSLMIPGSGIYRIIITTRDTKTLKLGQILMHGEALQGASILRARWRPTAAHTRFTASTLDKPTRVWVMELDAAPGKASFYSPMTTPFGYFGASWNTKGQPTGLNFSMWSYGRNQKEPRIETLSHLIALGDPNGKFGGFGHEGTGVKPRDCNPFTQWRHPSCVFALRMEPGQVYDTYYGYYYQPEEGRWRLYAAGRKAHKRAPNGKRRTKRRQAPSLWAGSFVEVPGPPQRQRSGHIIRKMRYRGFTMDIDGGWHPFDHMKGEGKKGEINNRGRGLDSQGRFELWTGGMQHFGPNAAVQTKEPTATKPLPWMRADRLQDILQVPTSIKLHSLTYEAGKATLTLTVKGLATDAKATVFFGASDGLTLSKRWEHQQELQGLREGRQALQFDCQKTTSLARVLVQHSEGQYWSTNSIKR